MERTFKFTALVNNFWFASFPFHFFIDVYGRILRSRESFYNVRYEHTTQMFTQCFIADFLFEDPRFTYAKSWMPCYQQQKLDQKDLIEHSTFV